MAMIWGDKLSEAGRFEEAAAEYDKAIESDPNNPAHYLAKGICLFSAKKYEDALDVLEKGLPLSEDGITKDFHKTIGLSYRRLGNPKKALEHYELAEELDPEDVELYSFIANVEADIERLNS
jgi:tetratricopeptide (TPR) repeat protein